MAASELSLPLPPEVKTTPLVGRSASLTVPTPESRTISPVVVPPRVRVWSLVVPRLPFPVKKVLLAPLLAEMEAVGVLPATLIKANLAEAVETPPRRRSRTEESLGVIVPLAEETSQTEPPAPEPQVPTPVTIPLEVVTQLGEPVVLPAAPLTVRLPRLRARVPAPLVGAMV